MPISTISGLIAVLLYLTAYFLQSRQLSLGSESAGRNQRQQSPSETHAGNRAVMILGLLAVLAHGWSAYHLIYASDGYHFGIVQISTLISASMSLLIILSSYNKPLGNLILGLFPLAILCIILSLSIESRFPAQTITPGIATHILLSILAYSFFTIAALQAAFLAFQNHQLKHHQLASVIKRFPPLQDMENFLFQLLWTGQILLSLGIVVGFLFVDDIWAEGLLRKTFFSLLAWLVFAVLLGGRHQLGWRGNTAIRGTLSGFALLILGFYGSKFVLEYILS